MEFLLKSEIQLLFWLFMVTVWCTQATEFNLTLVHTTECRDRLDGFCDPGASPCTNETRMAAGCCFGGIARRSTVLKTIRENSENVLLLDAGDQLQGTDWHYVYRGNSSAYFMNLLGYDAMSLGKGELILGSKVLESFLSQADFPALGSNVDPGNEPGLRNLIVPSRVFNLSGEQVGVVGYTSGYVTNLANTENLQFSPVVEAVQEAVDDLILNQGVNKIIAIGDGYPPIHKTVARLVRGVDIVVMGSPGFFFYTGDPPSTETPSEDYPLVLNSTHNETVLLVASRIHCKYLGHLEVTFDDEGVVTSYGGNPILLDENVEQDPAMLVEMEPWRGHIADVISAVVGSTDRTLIGDFDVCGGRECNLGNVITDAMVYSHGFEGDDDAHIALISSGSWYLDIPTGNVSVGHFTRLLEYGDTIDLLTLRGATIIGALETLIEDFTSTTLKYAFLQVAGLKIEYDLTKPVPHRVRRVQVRCSTCTSDDDDDDDTYEDIDGEAVYKVLTNSYIAGGEDGYGIIRDNTITRKRGKLDVEVMIEYFRANYPITTGIEGRITVYDADNRPPSEGSGCRVNQPMSMPFLAMVIVSLIETLRLRWL